MLGPMSSDTSVYTRSSRESVGRIAVLLCWSRTGACIPMCVREGGEYNVISGTAEYRIQSSGPHETEETAVARHAHL